MLVEKPVECGAIVLMKLRVDPCFERIEPEQRGGEAVNRADVAPFHVSQRVVNAAVQLILGQLVACDQRFNIALSFFLDGICRLAVELDIEKSLQALAQPELHLLGCFIGKSKGDDLGDFQRLGVAQQQMNQAID